MDQFLKQNLFELRFFASTDFLCAFNPCLNLQTVRFSEFYAFGFLCASCLLVIDYPGYALWQL
jgi:hypothetical protein